MCLCFVCVCGSESESKKGECLRARVEGRKKERKRGTLFKKIFEAQHFPPLSASPLNSTPTRPVSRTGTERAEREAGDTM